MDRRSFGKVTLGALSSALAGCSFSQQTAERIGRQCARASPADDILRVDMHCHLMNFGDSNPNAFVSRHVDERLGLAARFATNIAGVATHSAEAEARVLSMLFSDNLNSDTETAISNLCEEATRRQQGFAINENNFPAHIDQGAPMPIDVGRGRLFGFVSNRMRNASLMMSYWPEVDFFTPSIVDFYEGIHKGTDPLLNGEHPYHQSLFYEQLHLASRGRFLPLISFQPERAAKEDRRTDKVPLQLEMVRDAIVNRGFIGVKVHPSTGFSPIENDKYGCANTGFRGRSELTESEAERFQNALDQLYALCHELDVPVLTHNGVGLAANPDCMMSDPDPLKWSNSPAHWIRLLGKSSVDHPKSRLNVCLAHFASAFQDHFRAIHPEKHLKGKYEKGQMPAEYDKFGALIPSGWLQAAVDEIEHGQSGRLWLDLSDMGELAYSQARNTEGGTTVRSDLNLEGPFKSNFTDDGKMARGFQKFFERHTALWKRTMYGTDWHMPTVSKLGPLYRGLIEEMLPAEAREDVMGRNAVRFYGLQKGGRNRDRLLEFYKKNKLTDSNVRWIRRVDERMGVV